MDDTHQNQNLTLVLILAVAVSVLGSSFQYGYNIAVVNAPAKLIQQYFFEEENNEIMHENTTTFPATTFSSTYNSTATNNGSTSKVVEKFVLSPFQLFLWSFTVSIYTVGGMVGSYSTGFCIKRMGRKGTLLASNVLSIVGAILMGTSKAANSLAMIIIARFLLGIFAGLATGVVPLYIGEISPKRFRGGIGVINQLSITIGILTAQVLSLKEALGTNDLWPFLLAFTGIPSVVQLCTLPFLPESPRSLLIDNDQEEKARKALIRFRGTKNVSEEIREMRAEANAEAIGGQASALEIIRNRAVRWQLISIAVLQVTQQLCGINAIFYYLNRIFDKAGVSPDAQNYASVGVGAVNVIMTVISVVLMDCAGRKILLGGGYILAGFFSLLMTISLNLQETIPWMSSMSIASVVGFIIGFAIGPGPIPWLLTAEFFRQSTRPAASAIGSGLNWTFNFIVALVFPFMQEGMGAYVFVFFLTICIFATAYVIVVIPETKHKTFQEISKLFAIRNKLEEEEFELEEEGHIVKNNKRSV